MYLGELISFLEKRDPSTSMPLGFGRPHSYRGDYSNVAFRPVRDTTVGEMLQAARSALGTTYHGYKGGDYEMHEYVKCHLAAWGECGEEIGPLLLAFMCGETPTID